MSQRIATFERVFAPSAAPGSPPRPHLLISHFTQHILPYMRTSAPGIVPLFRSDTQARLLAELFEGQGAQHSVTDLARIVGAPVSSVAREVSRLEEYGLITVRQVGRTKLVAANWELRWARPLAELLAHTVGLPSLLAGAVRSLAGLEAAFVFGSWAARFCGSSGRAPNDIDLLLVGNVQYGDARDALRPVERDLGLVINPTIVETHRWYDDTTDPFLATVRSRPLVELDLHRAVLE